MTSVETHARFPTRTPIFALVACLSLLLTAAAVGMGATSARIGDDDPRSDAELERDQRRARSAMLKLSDLPGGWERQKVADDYFADGQAAADDLRVCERFVTLVDETPAMPGGFRAFAEKGFLGNEAVEQGVMVWPSVALATEFVQNFGDSDDVRCRVKIIERVVPHRLEELGLDDVEVKVSGRVRPVPQLGDDAIRIQLSLEVTRSEPMTMFWDMYMIQAGRAVTELVLMAREPGDRELRTRDLVELTVTRLAGVTDTDAPEPA